MKEEEKKISGEFEIVAEDGFSSKSLSDVLEIEKKCFPESWQYDTAEEYYQEMLKRKENINIFARKKGIVAGYLLGKLHNETVSEIEEYDELFKTKTDKFYYLETIGVVSDFRGKGLADKMIEKFIQEAKKRGTVGISIHARTTNKLSEKIKNTFSGSILRVRKIKSWFYGGGEPYEYIEWSI